MRDLSTSSAFAAGGGRSRRYRLHGSPDSANLVIRMVLEELGIPYEDVPVDRLAAQQKSAAYRRLNPQGLIPVLEVPGQDAPVFETGAILLFLADRYQALAPARKSPAWGRFLKWLFFISNTLHSDLRISFRPQRYFPQEDGLELFSQTLIGRIAASFGHLEREIAETGGPFLLGDEPTCADYYLAGCARWAQIYRNQDRWNLADTPKLRFLLEQLEARPAVRKACRMELIDGLPFTAPVPVRSPGATA
ncbi:glutathione S-transferase family protein [Roseibium salinum]|uniref:Glutathione S-transferase family protein n=1 Tax=Roseibium salinum TaxID=1604349 RepID=A0ABT3R397_9HYPH|nr:glutathione S-transferase family protein [Roseibium sp. DSM 29163]MCX2723610.1 glutathione S-transferase family protein [Roseibium sp. DSM 29163]